MKLKSTVDKWWKITLWVIGGIFTFLVVLGAIVGPTPVKATADNAIKACRSSDYAPGSEFLGSTSRTKPDGLWTPTEVGTDVYTMSQRVNDGSDHNPYTSSPPWICSASMAKDGLWTVRWSSGTSYQGTSYATVWYVKNAELRSVSMPRDLSGPGYGG